MRRTSQPHSPRKHPRVHAFPEPDTDPARFQARIHRPRNAAAAIASPHRIVPLPSRTPPASHRGSPAQAGGGHDQQVLVPPIRRCSHEPASPRASPCAASRLSLSASRSAYVSRGTPQKEDCESCRLRQQIAEVLLEYVLRVHYNLWPCRMHRTEGVRKCQSERATNRGTSAGDWTRC
jgi:hypothetical protein